MRLIIEDEEGRKTIVPFSRDEISIGRLEGNTIRLTERNVSRRHARLVRQTDAIVIEDLGSYNGVRVNGERVDRTAVHAGDIIEIGDYDLAIDGMPALPPEGDTNPNARAMGPATQPAPPREEKTAVTRTEDITNPNAPAPGRPLDPEKAPRLVGMAGSVAGKELRLPTTNSVVGRAPEKCAVVIDHDSVGRQHARFVLEDHTWMVQSLEHDHPVKVNGIPSDSSPIASGDTIEIGALKFRFTAPLGDATYPGTPMPVPSMRTTGVSPVVKPSNMPMIVGGIIVAVALAVLAFFILPKFTESKVDTHAAEQCGKAQGALTVQDWSEAITDLSVAKTQNLACGFDIDKQLGIARQNLDAQNALKNADKLVGEEKYMEAIALLQRVPEGSENYAAAKLKAVGVKSEGVQKLSDKARKAIDGSRLDEASSIIDDLKALDANASTLPLLIHDRDERKKAQEAPMNTVASSPRPAPVVRNVPEPAPAPEPVKTVVLAPAERTMDERNQMADAEINDGVQLIMKGDFQGGMERLQSALAEQPDKTRLARIHKNMGIAYVQKKQPEDAVVQMKLYLKLQPDAPDKAKFEAFIKKLEASGAK